MNAKCLALALLAGLGADPVVAEGLPDPTRPPAILDTAQTAATPAQSGLQSIIHRQGAKPAAVINGAYVELGGRIGDARLVRVGEDSVDLLTATGRETLQLTPGIGKRPVVTENGVAKRPRQGKHREGRGTEEAKP